MKSDEINMSYKHFYDSVIFSLGEYRKHLIPSIKAGTYRHHSKEHILFIDDDDPEAKYLAIRQYNILEEANMEPFLLPNKLHKFAHHLNSSQILCYNYFRPFIVNNAGVPILKASKQLSARVPALNDAHVIDSKFEYEQTIEIDPQNSQWYWTPKGAHKIEAEGTNFDFYVKTAEDEIFFEIKYTEQGFGHITDGDDVKKDGKYSDKFEHLYKKHIDECVAINDCMRHEITKDIFFKYYQLFRNVIRIKTSHQYAVFIFPEENTKCYAEFSDFKRFCKSSQVIGIYWRDLLDSKTKENGFNTKYFSF